MTELWSVEMYLKGDPRLLPIDPIEGFEKLCSMTFASMDAAEYAIDMAIRAVAGFDTDKYGFEIVHTEE